MVSPVIPGLTDHEVEAVLRAAADAGAVAASMIPLRLPLEVAPLFEEWLRAHVPDRARKVLSRVREYHGGKLYDAGFGARMRGQGVHAELLRARFRPRLPRGGAVATHAAAEVRPVRGPVGADGAALGRAAVEMTLSQIDRGNAPRIVTTASPRREGCVP